MVSDKEIEAVLEISRHFDEREERARSRVGTHNVDRPAWYFGILGATLSAERLPLDFMRIQRVVEPPGEVELARALKDREMFSAFARHARSLSVELVVPDLTPDKPNLPFSVAWWVTCCLNLRSAGEFLIPVVADRSWSTFAAVAEPTIQARLLDDYPKAMRTGPPFMISDDDVAWAAENFMKVGKVLADPRLGMALTAYSTHHHHGSLRMNAASLWAGIEAIFGVSNELKFRLSLLVAALVEPRGEARYTRYKRVQKLYDIRSRAVHGSEMSDADLRAHVAETRGLLARIITKIVETERVPSKDDFERALLTD